MAQQTRTLLIDDLDGSEAERTVRFGLAGAEYEIDLSAAHAVELEQALAEFVQAARKLARPPTAKQIGRGGRRNAAASGPSSSEVREWAKGQGIEVRDRGRIPAELVVRFQAAAVAP